MVAWGHVMILSQRHHPSHPEPSQPDYIVLTHISVNLGHSHLPPCLGLGGVCFHYANEASCLQDKIADFQQIFRQKTSPTSNASREKDKSKDPSHRPTK